MLDKVFLRQLSPRQTRGSLPPGDRTRPISRPVLVRAIQVVDFALLILAGLVSTAIRETALTTGELTVTTCIGATVAILAIRRYDGYTLPRLSQLRRNLQGLMLPLLIGWTAVIVNLFMLDDASMPVRAWSLAFVAFSAVLLATHRTLLRQAIVRWSANGRLVERIAIIGVNDFSATFLDRLVAQRGSYAVAGVYEDRQSRIPPHLQHIDVRGGVDTLMLQSRTERIDIVVIALPLSAVERINFILTQLSSLVADVFLTTDVAGLRYDGTQLTTIGSNPVVSVGERPIKGWQAVKKGSFDYVLGGAILLLAMPWLLIVALLIKLDSPGPVLFRQPRIGFDNRMFSIFKFRTMHSNMADLLADAQTTRDDARITRVGRWLRRYSIDELPQLLNVMQGDMSLVGPRPHAPNTKAANKLFADVVGQYAVRHRVKPGITGWAQVNGWRGETRTEEQLRQRVKFDLDYIQEWSLWLDLKIMALTVQREIHSSTAF